MGNRIKFSSSFKKSYEKHIKTNPILQRKFEEKLAVFVENIKDPRLRTHKLSGKLEDLWSFTIDYDCRVIFYFDEDVIILTDIGTHDEVY